jgi:lipopolysaccharide biosynthesis protein
MDTGARRSDEAARLLAFYLPQFHPIPENDVAWGAGFTEWTNVVRARPGFPGHRQPRLPADLGFYDLRLPEVREQQAALATDAGIDGFVYYHYWFAGRRLLHRPLDDVLGSGRPSLPFAICWANENWTRRWDGGDDVLLQVQAHSRDDDRQHATWLASAMRDARYLTVDGRPLLLIYKASLLPEVRATTDVFRQVIQDAGLPEPYLVMVESTGWERGRAPADLGFDASVDFFPDWDDLGHPLRHGRAWGITRRLGLTSKFFGDNRVYAYSDVVRRRLRRPLRVQPPQFPVVCPGWDNTPRRRSGAVVLHESDPVLYEAWLRSALDDVMALPAGERLVFVNAWNEWAEGATLEPSDVDGRAFLDATRRARSGSGQQVPVAHAAD